MKTFIKVLISAWIFFFMMGQAFSSENKQSAQKYDKKITITTRYLIYLPENYQKDKKEEWPLIIFLHGSGECGEDIEKVKANGPPQLISQGKKFPFIIVSPQCHKSSWGWKDVDSLMELLKRVESDYRIDKERIYLTGLSMGGLGTWVWAAKNPEIFAAIAPVCGESIENNAYRVKNLPTWIFHGGKDDTVPTANAIDMDKRLRECGADVRLTIYSNVGHNSWIEAYADENLYTWFLSHKRKPIKETFITNYRTLDCPQARTPVKIDGDLSEWKDVPFLTIATDDLSQHMRRVKLKKIAALGGKSSYRGANDCSAKIKMQ